MNDLNPFTGIFSPQPWDTQETTRPSTAGGGRAQAPLSSSPYDHPSTITAASTPASIRPRPGRRRQGRPVQEKLPLLQWEEWDKDHDYKEDPPICIRYCLGINITAKRRSVYKDTKPNLVLVPGSYWRISLRAEMEEVVHGVLGKDTFTKATETYILVSVTARGTPPLIKPYNGLDIVWKDIEDQLIEWSNHFQDGKNLRVDITFKYGDLTASSAKSSAIKACGNRRTTATRRMLQERHLQIDAEEHSTGELALWRDVYSLMRCPGSPCPLGPYCWIDPNGKRHYKLSTLILKEMIVYVSDDDPSHVLRTHDDVPVYIREMIYAEDRHKKDRKRKATSPPHTGSTPISIHNHFSDRAPGAAEAVSHSRPNIRQFSLSGLRDVLVHQYVQWQQKHVGDEFPKVEFETMGKEILAIGYDLETIYDEANLVFLNGKVGAGTVKRFIEDIPIWAELREKRRDSV